LVGETWWLTKPVLRRNVVAVVAADPAEAVVGTGAGVEPAVGVAVVEAVVGIEAAIVVATAATGGSSVDQF
jgi:hypothetical protein